MAHNRVAVNADNCAECQLGLRHAADQGDPKHVQVMNETGVAGQFRANQPACFSEG
jgi:hypothetical protein